jgi:hypothetical protein
MGVSFGEVVGDVQPEVTDTNEPERATPQPSPSQIDPILLRREIARLNLRDARLKAT